MNFKLKLPCTTRRNIAPYNSQFSILNFQLNAHVERTKSKLDYALDRALTDDEVRAIEAKVNEVIAADLPVTIEYAQQADVADRFNLERLPDGASETVRIVRVGDYDECLCAGTHVEHTAQIGTFRITSTRWQDGRQRIVFRLS